jgi:N-dimethylarginine dimethylaminohydrolase
MKLFIENETGKLRKAIICAPVNYYLTEPINETQTYYYKTVPPQKGKLISDHRTFSNILKKYNIDVMHIPGSPDSPYQTFTRDVGFVIHDRLFISRPLEEIRRQEILKLMTLLDEKEIKYTRLNKGCIEGGDVIIHGNQIFIGISSRTNDRGLEGFAKQLRAGFQLIPVRLAKGILHLDTVFSILNDRLAFVFDDGIYSEDRKVLEDKFDLIRIKHNEFFKLAINILFLSPDLAITQVQHGRINKILNMMGIKSIEIDYYEMIKLGGSFRCNCLPLLRE